MEDEARLRALLGRMLLEEHHVVELAATGGEALVLGSDGRGIAERAFLWRRLESLEGRAE